MGKRGPHIEELTGRRYGKLTVVEFDKTVPGRGPYWKCKCDCGSEISVRGNNLKTGNTTSCGCKIHNIEDLSGNRYGRWTVLEFYDMDRYGNSRWLCECDCGSRGIVTKPNLRNGTSKSCGCYKAERDVERHITHGMSSHRLYKIWRNVLDRCNNEKTNRYEYYGGKGISVCDEWYDFENFRDWALNNGYDDDLTIDRIDSDNIYCPENCRWVDYITQANNRSSCRYITYAGETHTISEWSRKFETSYSVLFNRIKRGDMSNFEEYFGFIDQDTVNFKT